MLKDIKELVKKKRKEKKLTQQQLADKLFISRTTISMIESNKRYTPSTHLAKALGEELNFDWTLFFN
ncbi:MAG: helix-turn-helix transcriptional regulator [Methanobrevibacter sp.]|uniref:helix-turn-helix transcriptional regulator n=1 Tax=Methanobrevibacter sp. TaxID=66852 RepID=UPI0031F580DE|nr:helix-turn-helix transcriptional regulator [Methanobrevibacter sp.]